MGKPGAKGIKRIINATAYSMKGLKAAWANEAAFRQELCIFLFIVPAGLLLGSGAVEKSLLIGSWIIVMITELINSAIEAVVDRIGPEHHELSGRAKDTGSAAVMLSLCLTGMIWFFIIAGKFFS